MTSRAGLVAFAILWLAAVTPAILATHDLQWPYDHDGFRDLALAGRAADGDWLADPYYKGEALWYSPLTAWIVAGTSALTGLSIQRAFIVVGAGLHLLIPLTFFVCVRGLLGLWPALAAVAMFLFLPGRAPAWAGATYSPWLFPALSAQIFLYAGLAVWTRLLNRPSQSLAALTGLLLGLSLLAHSSAAALLAAIVVVSACVSSAWTPRPTVRERLGYVALTALVAFIVALPLVATLVTHATDPVVNRAPATWVYEAVEPAALVQRLAKPASWLMLFACLWGVRLAWAFDTRVRVVLATWFGASLLGFVFAIAAERVDSLPAILPAYHFYFQLRAWQWVVAAIAFVAAAQMAGQRLNRRGLHRLTTEWAGCGLVLVAVAVAWPRYLRREALIEAPRVSRQLAERHDLSAAHDWIRRSTPRGAVILASDIDSMLIVGPSGRFAVCVGAYFSNPAVDVPARSAARDRLLGALRSGQADEVRALAAALGVTHVLARGDIASDIARHAALLARPAFTANPTPAGTAPSPVGLSDEPLTIFEMLR
jgi:hypothetical protein